MTRPDLDSLTLKALQSYAGLAEEMRALGDAGRSGDAWEICRAARAAIAANNKLAGILDEVFTGAANLDFTLSETAFAEKAMARQIGKEWIA